MEIKRSPLIEKELDSFLATKTITDVDRTKFLPFALFDRTNCLTTCLMFNCNCHSYEDPTIIPCEYTGAVIHLPAFWVEVPKELAFTYILGLIDQLYTETYRQWYIDGLIGPGNGGSNSGNGSSSGNDCCCPCGPNNGWTPVR